ncbi:MAG TPA: methyltransferase domain-containing protein [Chitinispirillaceae bacterium]|nr:methyltransferase domain-containing protein [Chitinispirillaceae bacterium]
MHCKLCGRMDVELFFSDPPRTYLHCSSCNLIFTSDDSYVTRAQEQARYAMHDNSESNHGYVRFLEVVAEMAIACTPSGGSVLDFGCGKNAVLETIIQRKCSLQCDSYDPLFDQNIIIPEKEYDTIVMCEVIEHLRNLHEELELLGKLLKINGILIVRTQKYKSLQMFPSWWYRQDSTHINFFNDASLSFVASLLNRISVPTSYNDIVILKPASLQG